MQVRSANQRIFVNKPVDFERIKAVGFDMDYTLVQYTPEYEELMFELAVSNLVNILHYPPKIADFKYDPDFAIKGLFIDTFYGNILKVDFLGIVHKCCHGHHQLSSSQIKELYTDGTIPLYELEHSKRYYLESTNFAAPLCTLFAELTDYFEQSQAIRDPLNPSAVTFLKIQPPQDTPKCQLCFNNLFLDCDDAMEKIHGPKEALKETTQQNLEKYVIKDPNIGLMLKKLSSAGKIVFLATNSGYEYTECLLKYELGDNFRDYFDYLIVDAGKPNFFTKMNPFRDIDSKGVYLLSHVEKLKQHHIYAFGNMTEFASELGLRKKDFLYVGDHIISDVGVGRNEQCRTLFICEEIKREVEVMNENIDLYDKLGELEQSRFILQEELCENQEEEIPEEFSNIQREIKEINKVINNKFNINFGSIFSTTWGFTWLGNNMKSQSDLYTWNCVNLINYPSFYRFESRIGHRMPHHQLIKNEAVKNSEQFVPGQLTNESVAGSTSMQNDFDY